MSCRWVVDMCVALGALSQLWTVLAVVRAADLLGEQGGPLLRGGGQKDGASVI
jgi:hypothetical protein